MLAPTLSSLVRSPAPAATDHLPFACSAPARFEESDDGSAFESWTDEDIVYLHWRMLQQVADLADPRCPLDEKFDTLRWIFAEPDKDERPFSFVNCLRIVGGSRLSPIPYCGRIDPEEVRDRIRSNLGRWLRASLERYPEWVQQAVVSRPDWVQEHMSRNPQWINEQLKRIKDQGDLFA
ncbi:hypothetical protein [Xanthomonas hortorum]|uniref:Uncharacterized protein n=1 Tax=Xanthomonas hortorum pv. hederae TaxID=453603 RepID=A0A9X4H9B6_9XANT|nr:hypothetical protein [Xanthomonas hortorum]MCE4369687.1 hypothetical protein [Xanthomonas hortorum pv. hederae]MDC8640166.1 hypothetical protein [Xanthomonas hortorum pv. hederae]PPU86227.1 hypothetical protein XhhCFBP4925_00400 [Xanthomonas hortorum pv. hederae]PUF01354.1 hypothetical protein C7T87_03270 [Xanthomonas hortorum pv. hederae]